MSYLRRKPEDEVWNIHAPLKKGSRELVTVPPISQIPYLNGVFDDEATINQLKPIYVRETDSDYIRQCKLGGSHDLLMHIDPATRKSKEPVAYPRPLWWDAMCEQIPSSSNVDNDDRKQKEKKSSKSEHNRSPGKQQKTASRKSQLPTNTKRK